MAPETNAPMKYPRPFVTKLMRPWAAARIFSGALIGIHLAADEEEIVAHAVQKNADR